MESKWLQTLTKIRKHDRDEKVSAVNEVEQAIEILKNRLDTCLHQLEKLVPERRELLARDSFDVNQLIELGRHEILLRSQHKELEGNMQILERERNKRREQLVAADRDVKVSEKLLERIVAREKTEALAIEQRGQDEAAAVGYVWRSRQCPN